MKTKNKSNSDHMDEDQKQIQKWPFGWRPKTNPIVTIWMKTKNKSDSDRLDVDPKQMQ